MYSGQLPKKNHLKKRRKRKFNRINLRAPKKQKRRKSYNQRLYKSQTRQKLQISRTYLRDSSKRKRQI